jgi:hypothetical protein
VPEIVERVDVAALYTCPFAPTASPPEDSDDRYRLPPIVDEAVEKKPFSPSTVVVELYPVLTVNGHANDDFELSVVCRSVPLSEIVPARRLVVEAVVNDAYVVDEYEKVWRAFHVLAVDVPNARENVLSDVKSPPPNSGYVVEIVLAFDAGVNPKIEDEAAVLSVPLLFDV